MSPEHSVSEGARMQCGILEALHVAALTPAPGESCCRCGGAWLLKPTRWASQLNCRDGIAHLMRVRNALEPFLHFALLLYQMPGDVVCSARAECFSVCCLFGKKGILAFTSDPHLRALR